MLLTSGVVGYLVYQTGSTYSGPIIFPIAVKELSAVVTAAAIYGNQWSGKFVQFKVDNIAVVHNQVIQAT